MNTTIHWFRKGLRVHDNAGLIQACNTSKLVYPVYILDLWHSNPSNVGDVRLKFILESLLDLDNQLKTLGVETGLLVFHGKPSVILKNLVKRLNVNQISFDKFEENEPHSIVEDEAIVTYMHDQNVKVINTSSHWLHSPQLYEKHVGAPPTTFLKFYELFSECGPVASPLPSPVHIPFENPIKLDTSGSILDCARFKQIALNEILRSTTITKKSGNKLESFFQQRRKEADTKLITARKSKTNESDRTMEILNKQNRKPTTPNENRITLKTLEKMSDKELKETYMKHCKSKYRGGESEALCRLQRIVSNRAKWSANFSKPTTKPNSIEPSTTVLSPYLTHGCLSVRQFWHEVKTCETKCNPEPNYSIQASLCGQLIWRELWYCIGYFSEFDISKMKGNGLCRQIPWDSNDEFLDRWKNGTTGYPFVDAIMIQLKDEGWIHHLARHMVACFLTRGDLWQSWEKGFAVFDEYLIDADWTLNSCNWMWLSCSAFYHQYFRCYSPVAFGKKTDKEGEYIRKYIPQLSKFPKKYIYEPWKAPLSVQKQANCIIGKDYPFPVVDHKEISKVNMNRMKAVFDKSKNKNKKRKMME